MEPPQTQRPSSPYKFPAATGFEAQSFLPRHEKLHPRIAQEMSGFFVGPMPPEKFLEAFLDPGPKKSQKISGLSAKYFETVPQNGTEPEMYGVFITLVKDLIPGFKIVNTGATPDSNSDPNRKIKPDPTMYKKSVNTSKNKTQFDKAEMNIEFKKDKDSEPFVDKPNPKKRHPFPFESDTKQGRGTRAQLTEYMAEVFSRQYRLFGFTLFICGTLARFIRWDRAGAIVSAQFDYHQNSQLLIEFLWRFCHLDDAKRGHDPSVRPANKHETGLARDKLKEWAPAKERPVVVFTVTDDNGTPKKFIGWGSMATRYSVTGRCTRAFPVYEEATGKCYFLKDGWRAHMLDPEANILRELAENQVEHVPKFLCGGDLAGQTTVTDLYVPEDSSPAPWVQGNDWSRITRRIHHRFVVDFIGKPLSTFKNSKHLTQVVFDGFTASQQAYERCHLIHRDVSGRNILIDENGRGVLNDWDLAKHEDELQQLRRHERTGTWQFMSCLLLNRHHFVHTIQDDMESFIHIMLYFGLRYLEHKPHIEIPQILAQIFDHEEHDPDSGLVIGGRIKRVLFESTNYFGIGFGFSSIPFQSWWRWAHAAARQWIQYSSPSPAPAEEIYFSAPNTEATPVVETNPELYDHSKMAWVFLQSLASTKWPTDERRPIDAAPDADGGRTKSSLRSSNRLESGHADEDGAIGSSRKQSQNSRGKGSRGGSSSHRVKKQSTPTHSMQTRAVSRSNQGA